MAAPYASSSTRIAIAESFGQNPGVASLRAGDTLREKFLIEAVIGAGGMGTVYQAVHIRMQTRVAIKVLDWDRAARSVNVGRFEREALAAARLRGSYAVRVYDVDTTESGAPFLVMELLRGSELTKMLEQPQPRETRIDWTIQICSAIHEAHELGIIHRDLKPSNIFIEQPSNQVKIVDFGISKVRDTVDLTADSEILGTPKYMSPEQLRGEKVGPHSDVWAIGIILYRMLADLHPFLVPPDSAPFVLAAASLTQEPVPILEYCPDLPKDLADAVMKCLQKPIAQRWQSARDLAHHLEPFGSGAVQFEAVPEQAYSAPLLSLPPAESAAKISAPPTAVEVKTANPEHAGVFHFSAASAGTASASAEERAPSEPKPRRGRMGWVGAALLVAVLGTATYWLGFRSDGSEVSRTADLPAPSAAAPNAGPVANADAGAQSPREAADDARDDAAVEVKPSTPTRGASKPTATRPPSRPPAKPPPTSAENPLFLP